MVAINATVGATDTNSYCTEAEADAYHETRLFVAVWTAANAATKVAALLWAARLLDERMEWDADSWVTDYGQSMQWPREGMYDRNGNVIPNDEIPQALKDAQAELARNLIASERTGDVTEGIAGLKVGSIDVQFSDSVRQSRKVIPDAVADMLSLWGKPISSRPSCIVSIERA